MTSGLSLDAINVRVDPKLEWAELSDNAWRLQRDFFYNTALNGVDWNAVHVSIASCCHSSGRGRI